MGSQSLPPQSSPSFCSPALALPLFPGRSLGKPDPQQTRRPLCPSPPPRSAAQKGFRQPRSLPPHPASSPPPHRLRTPCLRNRGPPFSPLPPPAPVRFSQADASMGSREWLGSVTLPGCSESPVSIRFSQLCSGVLEDECWGSWFWFGCLESVDPIRFSQASGPG